MNIQQYEEFLFTNLHTLYKGRKIGDPYSSESPVIPALQGYAIMRAESLESLINRYFKFIETL